MGKLAIGNESPLKCIFLYSNYLVNTSFDNVSLANPEHFQGSAQIDETSPPVKVQSHFESCRYGQEFSCLLLM